VQIVVYKVNPSQSNWFRQSISRGCVPNNAYPFSYTPHYAKYVDPTTGKEDKIVVVPAAMAMSWDDGYGCYGTQDIQTLSKENDPEHPMLIVLAHDGDNDFGGGYTYYLQCVPSLMGQAASQGFNPTTVDQYLDDFPVDPNDVVHVEDGAWVNADGDFGSPQFINWNWPLTGNDTQPDYDVNGWQVNERNWAVITAAQNVAETAEQMMGGARISEIQNPSSDATPAELAWHFFLPSMTSGYMYYGAVEDMFLKQTVACNIAVQWGQKAISQARTTDRTAPSIWYVMRQPYNPGGYGAGSLWKYKYTKMSSNFFIYSFVYDVSGVSKVTLFIREDEDGMNPIDDNANEVFQPYTLGLKGVGDWTSIPMTRRKFPKGDEQNIHFSILPTLISDEYYAQVTDMENILLDYYIQAIDTLGNVKNSDIYHVYVGSSS